MEVSGETLGQVENPYVKMSFELQRVFGLRRKECLMLRPWEADHGPSLVVQGSWAKGGRERVIPITTAEQRDVLERAKALVHFKHASRMPKDLQYHQQRNRYTEVARKLQLRKLHGLRHTHAQRRYEELAGFPCPVCGGPSLAEMSAEQREIDATVRGLLSEELGHCRPAIVAGRQSPVEERACGTDGNWDSGCSCWPRWRRPNN